MPCIRVFTNDIAYQQKDNVHRNSVICLALTPLTVCQGLLAALVFHFVLTALMKLAPLESGLLCPFQCFLPPFHYMHHTLTPSCTWRRILNQVYLVHCIEDIVLALVCLLTADPLRLSHMLLRCCHLTHFQNNANILDAY